MNTAAQAQLAWELADLVAPVASSSERTAAYVWIGAGDTYCAIDMLVRICVQRRVLLQAPTVRKLTALLNAYGTSEEGLRLESLLAALVTRSGVPEQVIPNADVNRSLARVGVKDPVIHHNWKET